MSRNTKLPERWMEVEFQEIADKEHPYPIGDGDHGQITPSMYQSDGIPYIRVGDMVNDKISFENIVYISEKVHKENIGKELVPGDVIIAKTGATIGKVAIIPPTIKRANTTASIGKITLNKQLAMPEYALYFMKTHYFTSQMWAVSKKSAQPGFNIKDIKKFKIILPPLPTQQKIVSILEKAEETQQWREEADELTKEFLSAVFMEMFGDPIINNKKWEIKKGKDLFKFSSGKFNPTSNLNDSFEFPTYGGNGITGYSKDYLIDFPTIVIGRVGAYCGCIHKTPSKSWITDNAIYIKEFKQKLNFYFLFYLFEFLRINRFALTVGQPKITQKPLEESFYIFPPIELQQKFASILKEVEQLKEQQKRSKEQIDNLYNDLMQKAFTGELVA